MKPRSGLILLVLVAAAVACGNGPSADGHGHEHEPADEHAHGHAHGGGIAVTDVTDATELFVEFDPLVVGQESAFAAHLTRLSDYRAVDGGTAVVVLRGGGAPEERFSAQIGDTPGIFRPVAVPTHAGTRELSLELEGEAIESVHALGSYEVYASADQVPEQEEAEDAGISFLKEQQWKVAFAVRPVVRRDMRAGLRVYGHIQARPDREAVVNAPSRGRLLVTESMPNIGAHVRRGDRLVTLAPELAIGGDLATLQMNVDRAKAALGHAERELARLTKLRDQGAVSERRVSEAQVAHDQTRAELRAARRRAAQFTRLQRPDARQPTDAIELRSPIEGLVVDVHATPGEFVEAGEDLFHIVDASALQVRAFVPEADLDELREVHGAWIWIGHSSTDAAPLELGADAVLSTAGPVDASTHAVEVVLELPIDTPARVGQPVDVQLMFATRASMLAIPVRALVWDAGIPSAFVMLEGESFERRSLRLGDRDGDWIAVVAGLAEGERIVTEGADLVALAQAAPAQAGHGHLH